jgi:hypothetical protein
MAARKSSSSEQDVVPLVLPLALAAPEAHARDADALPNKVRPEACPGLEAVAAIATVPLGQVELREQVRSEQH